MVTSEKYLKEGYLEIFWNVVRLEEDREDLEICGYKKWQWNEKEGR